VRRHIFYRSIN